MNITLSLFRKEDIIKKRSLCISQCNIPILSTILLNMNLTHMFPRHIIALMSFHLPTEPIALTLRQIMILIPRKIHIPIPYR